MSAGWEPIRPDARYDKVHDLKKCARIEVVYDEVSAKPRNFFFFSFLFLIFDGKVSQAFSRDAQTYNVNESKSVSSFLKLLLRSSLLDRSSLID